MRHRKHKITLDRNSSQRRRLLRQLAISLITTERLRTTPAKARAVRSLVERLVTHAKKSSITQRRYIFSMLADQLATTKLIDTLGPRFRARTGGYVRLIKMQRRNGDGAEQCLVEFVT